MGEDDKFAPGGGGGSTDEETKTFFVLGLYVPTVTDESGEPKLASELSNAMEPANHDRLIAVPSNASTSGGGYTVDVPAVLWWKSNVDADEFGNVRVTTNHGVEETLDSPSGTVEDSLRVYYDSTLESKTSRPIVTPKYFRTLNLKLTVEFEGDGELAGLAPEDTIEERSQYVTANKSLQGVKDVLDDAEYVTDKGLSAAGRLTGVKNTGLLRKAARMLAYGSVHGVDAVSEQDIGGDLVRHAAVKGIGGFKEVVDEASNLENYLDENQSLYTSMLGPTIKFDDFAPEIEVRPSSPTVHEEVTLGPSWSTVPDVPIERYEWEIEMDDGTLDSGSGETFTVSFPREGTYSVLLTTTDEDGNTGTTRRSVSVDP